MDESLISHLPKPSRERPLAGSTVLVVEDSRFASEAIRLLCLRSGARIRRADSLGSARRHLAVYRPSVVIVDMGLPDGSGAELIGQLADGASRPVILGLSGDPEARARAGAAGADGFLAKPVESLATFQQAVLAALPPEARPGGLRPVDSETVEPDPVALAEDLLNAADLLTEARASGEYGYLVHFLQGVALTAHDAELGAACADLGDGPAPVPDRMEALLRDRIAATG